MYHGDFALESTFDVKFTTRRFTTGAPFALASGTISAYVDNNVTQLTAGITLSADFDGVTGLNNVRVVATAANGYAAGGNYTLVITVGTVDSVSVVGECVGSFSIQARSALRPTVATRTLDVSAGGEAGLDWANIGSPTTAQNLSATNIDVDQIVASVSGAVGSVTGAVGSVTGSVGSIAANGLSATSIATGAITAAKFAANAIDAAALAADAGTEIGTAVWATTTRQLTGTQTFNVTGNITGNVTGSVGSVATGGIAAASFAAGAINAAAIATGAVDADALAADASAEIADAVWDELLSGHVIVGSAGAALASAGSAGDPWSTLLPGAYGAGTAGNIVGTNLDAQVSLVKAKTDMLTFTTANQVDSRVMSMANGTVTAAAVATDAIDADALAADALAEINAQVVDALATDTYAEPGQGNPAATASLATKIGYIYKGTRNKHDQNATTFELYADDGTTIDQKATVSDDGTTFTRGKLTSGP